MAVKGPPFPEPTTPPPAGYTYKEIPFPEGYKIKPPKHKPKKPLIKKIFLIEVLGGIGLFAFITMSTSAKIKKEKEANSQKQYITIDDSALPPKSTIKEVTSSKIINISDFSKAEQDYINSRCKNKKEVAPKNRCIKKSINELLDLY